MISETASSLGHREAIYYHLRAQPNTMAPYALLQTLLDAHSSGPRIRLIERRDVVKKPTSADGLILESWVCPCYTRNAGTLNEHLLIADLLGPRLHGRQSDHHGSSNSRQHAPRRPLAQAHLARTHIRNVPWHFYICSRAPIWLVSLSHRHLLEHELESAQRDILD